MRIDADQLYRVLRAQSPTVFGYTDGAAALAALAHVESDDDDATVGDFGESFGLWQVHRPDWPEYTFPPPRFPDQVRWLLDGPAVARYNEQTRNAGATANLARWWRHGHVDASADPLDLFRELRFHLEYERLANAHPSAGASSPRPGPGGTGRGGIFSAAAPAAPTVGEMTMATTAPVPAPRTSTLDDVRKQADRIRKMVDQVASIVASVPFVGPVIGGYVRAIDLLVEGLDDAIDALDTP